MNGTEFPEAMRVTYQTGFKDGLAAAKKIEAQRRAAARLRRVPNNVVSIIGRLQERSLVELPNDEREAF